MIKIVLLASLLAGTATAAMADGTCKSNASDKKLAGAAMTSFMKKCQTDAGKSCDDQAAAKKLAGAAKSSFTKEVPDRRRRNLIGEAWPQAGEG